MAERALMKQAIKQCLTKNHLSIDSVDLFVAGDLSNQTTASSFVARDLQLPYIGTYSACATSVETLIISGVWVSSGLADLVLAAASSHYGACEKQFRYPTEFAVQKPETAQTTVTGAGAVLLGKKRTQIQLTEATIGRVQDLGITDPMSLGAAMAPAAAEVTIGHLHKTNQQVSDFDLIVTGDLAISGSEIYRKLLREQGIYITGRYEDCGVMMYHSKQQALAGEWRRLFRIRCIWAYLPSPSRRRTKTCPCRCNWGPSKFDDRFTKAIDPSNCPCNCPGKEELANGVFMGVFSRWSHLFNRSGFARRSKADPCSNARRDGNSGNRP